MDDSIDISFHSSEDVKPRSTNKECLIYEWTINDLKTLCSRIKDASLRLNKAVNAPYNRTENRLNWDSIAFDGYGAEECRTKWQQLCTNIRTYRTMAELVGDAELWLQKGPRKAKEAKVMGKAHPDKPSRPPTIFFKFLMEQLPKVKKKHPELTHRQIVSKIGEMYKSVTPKKKDQLKAEFLEEQEIYRKRLEEFYDAHPDVAPSKGPTNATQKGTSGLAFFIAERLKDPRNSDLSKEDLRAKWLKLKDEKKIPYIEMALDALRKTSGVGHFIAKPSKDVLSKDERIVYDRFLGKPEKPPSTGFALFKNIANATKFKDLDVSQRSQAAQEVWNALSKPDQYKFNNEAKILKQQYDNKMEEYTKRVAEREQKLADSSNAGKLNNIGSQSPTIGNGAPPAKRLKAETTPTGSPKKSILKVVVPGLRKAPKKLSALTWYQESCLDEWKQVNPQLSEDELRSAMAEEFAGLSERKKEKWARKAEKENTRRGLN